MVRVKELNGNIEDETMYWFQFQYGAGKSYALVEITNRTASFQFQYGAGKRITK